MQASTSLPAIRAKPPARVPAEGAEFLIPRRLVVTAQRTRSPVCQKQAVHVPSLPSRQPSAPSRLSHASAVLASLPSKWNHFLIVLFIILPPFLCGPMWGIGPYAAV